MASEGTLRSIVIVETREDICWNTFAAPFLTGGISVFGLFTEGAVFKNRINLHAHTQRRNEPQEYIIVMVSAAGEEKSTRIMKVWLWLNAWYTITTSHRKPSWKHHLWSTKYEPLMYPNHTPKHKQELFNRIGDTYPRHPQSCDAFENLYYISSESNGSASINKCIWSGITLASNILYPLVWAIVSSCSLLVFSSFFWNMIKYLFVSSISH